MSRITPSTFAEHVESNCGALVRDAAPAIGADVQVLDESGRVVLSARRHDDGDAPAPKWAFSLEIAVSHDVVGTLRASSASEASRALLTTLAHDIGTRVTAAVEMDVMIDRLATCYDELELLHKMSAALRPDMRVAASCRALLEECARHLAGVPVFVYLLHEDHLELTGGEGDPLEERLPALRDAKTLYRSIVDAADPTDGDLDPDVTRGTLTPSSGHVGYAGFALYERGHIAGFVGRLHAADREPTDTGELKLLEALARQLTDVVTRGAILEDLRDMLFKTVKSLVAAIDAKDAYTRGHSERVHEISVAIGEALSLPAEEQQNLAWAALLHDVGKIAIPEEILRKPGALTRDELRLVQTHPTRGETLLRPITQLAGILPGIRSHHERMDGRGYPDQLAGDAIPRIARIIAVADTYDALVSTRAFRHARTREYAIREIERSAVTQLDPAIVDVFLELVRTEGSTIAGPEDLADAA